MIVIHVEEIKGHLKRLNYVNSLDLNEIEWFEHGQPLNISKELINEFELTGLNNSDLISTNFYRLEELHKQEKILDAEEYLYGLTQSSNYNDEEMIEILQKGLDKLKEEI